MTDDPSQKIHLETVDFCDNRIFCTELQWLDHIVAPARHIELEFAEELIVVALQKPSHGIRYIDAEKDNRRVYYGPGGLARYTKVIVEFQNPMGIGNGHIVTALPTNNMKHNEKPEWPEK